MTTPDRTTNGAPRIDSGLVRRRRTELALSLRALAAATGVAAPQLVALEHGRNHPDLTLGFLHRLADALALDITDLLRNPTPEPARDDPTSETPTSEDFDLERDAATVGSVLHATGVLTPIATLADVLGWPDERTNRALDTLAARLDAAGLRLHRLLGRVSISRAMDAVDSEQLARALRAHLARDGINLAEARMLRRVISGDVPREPTNPEGVALGVLVNAGLITTDEATTPTSVPPFVPSHDVRYSIMLDDNQN